ncbi:hypothetical protein ABT124_40995 [Streptomyces sp. NPDC001982]|uniref:hypothetical protein n=1 Tax=unclassified Streptomyces TaxID=2593676 RepID=UPI00331978B4
MLGLEPCRVHLREGSPIQVGECVHGPAVRFCPLQDLYDPVEDGSVDLHAIEELPAGHPCQLDSQATGQDSELDLPCDSTVRPVSPALNIGPEDFALPFGRRVGQEPAERVR